MSLVWPEHGSRPRSNVALPLNMVDVGAVKVVTCLGYSLPPKSLIKTAKQQTQRLPQSCPSSARHMTDPVGASLRHTEAAVIHRP